MVSKPVLVALLLTFLISGFVIGILIGIYGVGPPDDDADDKSTTEDDDDDYDDRSHRMTKDYFFFNKKVTRNIVAEIDGDNIKSYLTEIGKKSHVAGIDSDRVADYIKDKWISFGLKEVHQEEYEVLLSYPSDDEDQGNSVDLTSATDCSSNEGVSATSSAREPPDDNREADDDFPDAYHAYSPSGVVQGDVIYANYGTEEDFDDLEKWGINVTGHIIIARYGRIFRGNKVANAAMRNAAGVLLYADPEESAPDDGKTYPDGRWLPKDGLQRGTIYEKIGDPLTPGLPAKDEMYRLELDEANLPGIPSQPITYDFAREVLSRMAGTEPNDDNWQGGFNFPYRVGPKFEGSYENHTVCLSVYNELKEKANIYNVIGVIPGDIEPDRYVIIGNPHDAWGYGFVNPSSSTAQLLEVARVFGKLHKAGWKPRRTIIFAAWDAGKFGQIGSTEWVEEHLSQLQSRTVAYINSESCVETDEFTISASPILKKAVLRVAKLIPARKLAGKKTLFDQWQSGDEDDENKYAESGEVDEKATDDDKKLDKKEKKKKKKVHTIEVTPPARRGKRDDDDDDDDNDDDEKDPKTDNGNDKDGDDTGEDDTTTEPGKDKDKDDDTDEDTDTDDVGTTKTPEDDDDDDDDVGTKTPEDDDDDSKTEDDDSDDDDDDSDEMFDGDDEEAQFDKIEVSTLGAESDHAAFAFYAGIPSIDVHANNEKGSADFIPILNTAYDTLDYFTRFVDKDMSRSVTCAQYIGVLARYFADSSVLPYDVEYLGDVLQKAALKLHHIDDDLEKRNITLFDEFDRAVSKFEDAADLFSQSMKKLNRSDPLAVRIVNDQMMQLERVFLDPRGQEDDWFQRHLIFGPSDFDKNSDSIFNVMDDLIKRLDEIEEEEQSEEDESSEEAAEDDSDNIEIDVEETWDEIGRYVSHLSVVINQASEFLQTYPHYHEEVEEQDASDEESDSESE